MGDDQMNRMLMRAIRNEHLPTVEHALKNGANVNYQEENGVSALMDATQQGYSDCAKALLEHGAQVDLKNPNNGSTALMLASGAGHADIVKLLLKYGAQANLKSYLQAKGTTALIQASAAGNAEVVEILCRHDDQLVHQTLSDNTTALQTACCGNDRYKVVKVLLKYGAQVNLQDAKGGSALIYATLNNDYHVVKLLLEHGAEVDARDCNGVSALMYASVCMENGSEKTVELLLNHSAQIDLQEFRRGWSALMQASFKGCVENAKKLLDYGAQVGLRDKEGRTPLIIACSNGFDQVAKVLLEHGAKVNVKDADGVSPLLEARLKRHENVATLLQQFGAQDDLTGGKTTQPLQAQNVVTAELLQPSLAVMGITVGQGLATTKPVSTPNFEEFEPQAQDSRPTLQRAYKLLLPLAGDWQNIGVLLGLDGGTLNAIDHNHKRVQSCLREMLQEWLKKPAPTWQELAYAVHPFDPEKAKEIRLI